MPYCRKCGAKVEEEMAFCSKCGASLKVEQPREIVEQRIRYEKEEKAEKREKAEKGEKAEKHEKGEFAFIGPLIGGLILIFLGLMFYLHLTGFLLREIAWAVFFIAIGIVIIAAAIYAATQASKRHPKT